MKRALLLTFVALFAGTAFAAELAKVPLTLATSDAVSISAYFVKGPAEKGPAVILLHAFKGSKEDWSPIIEKYLAPQIPCSFLAIDLRGHGQSLAQGSRDLVLDAFTDKDFNNMTRDVDAAVKWLKARPDVDPSRIAVIGAGLGANVALNCAAADKTIKCVALLSPNLENRGVKTDQSISMYAERPIFLAAAREDLLSGQDVKPLTKGARGKKYVEYYEGNLHGTKMFGNYPVDKRLAAFIKENL
jgi:alpha-beta hydrolase superfamily lysophospholipase